MMNARQRLRAAGLGFAADRGLLAPEQYWPETLLRWRREGMDDDFDAGYDFDAGRAYGASGFEAGYLPPWPRDVVAEDEHSVTFYDEYGVLKRTYKDRSSMPEFLKFPATGREDWERLRPRLEFSPQRFPDDWKQRVRRLNDGGEPVFFAPGHLTGFFGFLRELFGHQCFYLFYDDPGLVADVMDFQAGRLCRFIEEITRELRVDKLCIWEDMCYRNGPLIGPGPFERYILPGLSRVVDRAKECGIELIDVDSDGNVWELLPLWAEAGVNMMHPFEVAAGMDVAEVRRRIPSIAVSGGIDKRALALGRAAIDKEFERVRPAMEAGRYIPAVDHSIPPDVSFDDFRYYLDKRARFVEP